MFAVLLLSAELDPIALLTFIEVDPFTRPFLVDDLPRPGLSNGDMKKLILACCVLVAFSALTFAGSETYSSKEMKQVAPPPCPQWYADYELNVDLWGTYLFTGNDWPDDRYINGDHAWGGGGDIKYFFMRYFGVGIEGWGVDAKRHFIRDNDGDPITFPNVGDEHRAVGAVLGTLTFRYPIPCTRFAPYVFAGGGAIFGGGERRSFDESDGDLVNDDTDTRAIGQFGGGIEVRITPHIGWMNDFSWNVVDGPDNDFGMARSGLNFAF